MNNRILLIRTGGTIDAEPYEHLKNPPEIVNTLKGDDSLIANILKTLPNHEKVDILPWNEVDEAAFVQDSQQLTPYHMLALANDIKGKNQKYFILLHGTSDMAPNAELLQKALEGTDKTVVFVGAMVPLSMHLQHKSDGVEALAFALEHIAQQPAGVYIVGRDSRTKRLGFFNPAKVEKDRKASLENLDFMLAPR